MKIVVYNCKTYLDIVTYCTTSMQSCKHLPHECKIHSTAYILFSQFHNMCRTSTNISYDIYTSSLLVCDLFAVYISDLYISKFVLCFHVFSIKSFLISSLVYQFLQFCLLICLTWFIFVFQSLILFSSVLVVFVFFYFYFTELFFLLFFQLFLFILLFYINCNM